MRKRAAQYVEAVQNDPAQFCNQVLHKAIRPKSGVWRSLADPDALVRRVRALLEDAAKAR